MIFVSYSQDDRKFCDAFIRMASPLTRYGGIRLWSDSDIQAGKSWKKEIDKALDATSVAVLLVTDSFLDSHFIQTVELPYFIAATKNRGIELMWVLVSDCLWKKTPLGSIQAAFRTAKPIDFLSSSQQKTAWRSVAERVDEAWKRYERPEINTNLKDRAVNRRETNLRLLSKPAHRRTEIFVRAEGGKEWWHQCSIAPGRTDGNCTFGNEKTKKGHRFQIVAMTTDQVVGGKSERLPGHRTRAVGVSVRRR
jgi:TIR domain